MRILVFNAGSSSLKHALFEVASAGGAPVPRDSGSVEKIGEGPDKPDPARAALEVLARLAGEDASRRLDALAHRIVHGGERFEAPALLDEEAIAALERLGEIAPLHNAPALSVVKICREARPGLPQVGVFDTAFHRSLPERAAAYAIDPDLAARHGVRRFGFHGIAYRSMMETYSALRGRPPEELRLIAFHLGNGASACAIDRGRSIETSMGFTPLEGLVMGTRSGDLDPALVPFLARREGVSAAEVVEWLNARSGLAGVSGASRDVREVERAAAAGSARARLALDLFAHRARKFLGAYLAVLGGADAVLFGGGIGEHSPGIREAILGGLEELGLRLDRGRNDSLRGEGRISADDSRIDVFVLATDEESVIARDAAALLAKR